MYKNILQDKKIVITTGGTGGHMYPAIKTAQYAKTLGADVYLVSDKRGINWCTPRYTDIFTHIKAVFSRTVVGRTKISKIISVLLILLGGGQAVLWLIKMRPNMVVGFGGYASVPLLFACVILRIPFVLHEQNAYAGRVNRLFSKWAKQIAISFKQTQGINPHICTYTGNPIRTDIAKCYDKAYSKNTDKIHIVITGGSQGAKVFGDVIPHVLSVYADKITVTQQVRQAQIPQVTKIYKKHKIPATVQPFIEDMVSALTQADIAIVRSGASTVMENACVGVPSIFVPYKYASDDHQTHNATQATGGIVVPETPELQNLLQKQLDLLILDTDAYKRRLNLAIAGKNFFMPNAEKAICNMIIPYI